MIVFEEPTNGDLASRRTLSNATNVTSFVTYQRNQMLEELADILPYSDQASKDLVRMSRLLWWGGGGYSKNTRSSWEPRWGLIHNGGGRQNNCYWFPQEPVAIFFFENKNLRKIGCFIQCILQTRLVPLVGDKTCDIQWSRWTRQIIVLFLKVAAGSSSSVGQDREVRSSSSGSSHVREWPNLWHL